MDGASDIALDDDELLCVRSILELFGDEHGAFGPIERDVPPARFESATRRLVERGLLDRPAYRPDRDLVRRLLVTCEPDQRLVLLAAGPGSAERVLDAYERTGAWVRCARRGGEHVLSAPEERPAIRDRLAAPFTARRSTGDFIDLRLDPAESFAFMTFAQSLGLDGEPRSLGPERPHEGADPTLEGAVLVPSAGGRRAVVRPRIPDEAAWAAALTRLVARDVLRKEDGGHYRLKPYLLDLARGITQQTRYVLTHFRFGAEAPAVTDASLVPVPGSMFSLRVGQQGELRIAELDAPGLDRLLDGLLDGDAA